MMLYDIQNTNWAQGRIENIDNVFHHKPKKKSYDGSDVPLIFKSPQFFLRHMPTVLDHLRFLLSRPNDDLLPHHRSWRVQFTSDIPGSQQEEANKYSYRHSFPKLILV